MPIDQPGAERWPTPEAEPERNEEGFYFSRRSDGTGHWLTFDEQRRIVGCHCGFAADVDEDAGWGDSVLDHFEEVVRADERGKAARVLDR